MLDYEELIGAAEADDFEYPDLNERSAAAMCYTSGTTGRPKGVVYSHRAIALHSLGHTMADSLAVQESDVALPVVPMFHANAWGLPFSATMVGAKQVFPGPHLDPASLLEDFESRERHYNGRGADDLARPLADSGRGDPANTTSRRCGPCSWAAPRRRRP